MAMIPFRYSVVAAVFRFLTFSAFHWTGIVTLGAENRFYAVQSVVTEIRIVSWDAKKGVWYEGKPAKRITETFDQQDRIILKELADGKSVLLEKTVTRYDENTATSDTYSPDGILRRTRAVERNGLEEQVTVRTADGSVLFLEKRTYDGDGKIKEIVRRDGNGGPLFTQVMHYNEQGHLASINVMNPEGTEAATITYQYTATDKQGAWVTRREFYSYADVYNRPHETQTRRIVYRRRR
jgi:hypothetical protein